MTMADLLASPVRPRWLIEAARITGPVRLVRPDGTQILVLISTTAGTATIRTIPPQITLHADHAWNNATDAQTVPVPPIPYPESAGPDWLQGRASLQGWGGSDFPWRRAGLFGHDGHSFAICDPYCHPHERIVWVERREIPLPNGQPAYLYAGQCPRCGAIYWGT